MKDRGISFRTQVIIIVSVLLLAANVLLGTVLMSQSKAAMKTLIHDRMLDIANTAAAMLDGDALELLEPEDEGTEGYQAVMDALTIFQDNIDLEYIYCVRDLGGGRFVFTVDPTVEDPGQFGEPVVYTEALHTASLGTPAVDEEPYSDDWGRFYSAYSPVFDSAGAVAGIVAVDFSAEWYDAQIARHTNAILLASVLSLLLGAVIVLLVTSRLRKRFRTLNAELGELAGDVDALTREFTVTSGWESRPLPAPGAEADSRPGDEINELGRRVRAMQEELRKYIDHLHSQANSMITALASDYRSVYYVDLDTDEGVCYRAHADLDGTGFKVGERFRYLQSVTAYANRFITEQYREEFLRFVQPEAIRKGLNVRPVISYTYMVLRHGKENYETVRFAGVHLPEDRKGQEINTVGACFVDADAEVRETIAQRQALSDALAAAEAASKAKTAFLSNMSHEIRTPMNAIIGLDSIALNDPDISDTTRNHLEKIGSSAEHLLQLINDILDMSRIESGRMMLKKEEFSFPKLLKTINTMFSGQCQEKGLDYQCHLHGEVDDYYIGDNMKLRQVLINILGNAVKFTPEGGKVELTVERKAKFDGKSTLCFIISDTGIGMSKEFLPHIFDAFAQEDSSATNRYGSSGLGLAITKNIVEMMNGDIQVESEKGRGTSFTVTVTLDDSAQTHSDGGVEEIHPSDMTVLIVDDDPVACQHARLVLEKAGIAAEIASSGAEAIEMVRLRHARREPYNLILVDWQMPEMDGVETTRRIRSIVGRESAIIILTAYRWDDILEEAVQAGVDSFLSKPLFAATVLEEFLSALKKRSAVSQQNQVKAKLEGRRILLAEDMKVNAEIMMMVLEMRQIETELAENGKLAVEMFSSHPVGYYDAILMDMRMPEMDGLEATRTIRALDREDAKKSPSLP